MLERKHFELLIGRTIETLTFAPYCIHFRLF